MIRGFKYWPAGVNGQRMKGLALPGARFERPEAWTEMDQVNFDAFLKTPAVGKFLLTLHALVTDRALSVCDRRPFEHGYGFILEIIPESMKRH